MRWWCLVLAGSLAAQTEAFAPAPIRWGGVTARNLVLAPKGVSSLPQALTILDRPSEITPRFYQKADETIILEGTGWCIEASDHKPGAEVRVNTCTGGPGQRWEVVPDGRRGREMIQLKNTNNCLDLSGKDGEVSVELRSCDGDTESWKFEGAIPLATTRWSLQNVVLAFLSMVAVAASSFGVWLRWKQSKVRTLNAGVSGMPLNADEGGVSLSALSPTRCDNLPLIPNAADLSLPSVLAAMALSPVRNQDDQEEQETLLTNQSSAVSNLFSALDRRGEKAPFIKEASELIPQVAVLDVHEAAEALYKYADALTRQAVPESLRNDVNAFVRQATALTAMAVAMTPNAALAADEAVPEAAEAAEAVSEAVSIYSKVDKTGWVGGVADVIEQGIDLAHNGLQDAGISGAYGISICLFTLLIKTLTFPLLKQTTESSTKMQALQPYTEKIQQAFPGTSEAEQQRKGQLTMQLYQSTGVNPLAGILPAFIQIPVFISFYRALTNLVGEDKLEEPFLWLPNLEGPVYQSVPGQTLDWFTSITSGTPKLGWEDTIAFLTLPVALWATQTVSMRALRPPRDPNKVMTDQETITQGLIDNLPLVVAFFSLNAPAGLGIYWLANNVLTTVITLLVKAGIKTDSINESVAQVMQLVDKQLEKKKGRSQLKPLNTRGFAPGTDRGQTRRAAESVTVQSVATPKPPSDVTVRVRSPNQSGDIGIDQSQVEPEPMMPSTTDQPTVESAPTQRKAKKGNLKKKKRKDRKRK